MTSERSRGWCFTLNNYTDDDYKQLVDLTYEYLIIGKEQGTKKQTPHLQGFIYFKTQKSFLKMTKINKNIHWEKQKGSNVDAIYYCMKDEQYEEFGKRPRQGKRSDLDIIKHDIKKGKSDKLIAEDYFGQWCQYRRAFNEYRKLITPKFDTVLLIYNQDKPLTIRECMQYKTKDTYIFESYYSDSEIWLKYFSGDYDYIIVRSTSQLDEAIDKMNRKKENVKYKYICHGEPIEDVDALILNDDTDDESTE